MNHPTDKKNLTQLEVIELLTLLKTESENTVADHMGIAQSTVHYYKKKYDAFTPEIIDRAILQLERENIGDVVETNYRKQAECNPKTFYFKCHTCGFVASENNIQGIREHLDRCDKSRGLLIKQSL